MDRSAYLRTLTRVLGRRRVVYFGTRGADARSLTDLMNFDCIFSQIAPSGMGGVEEVCLERKIKRRVDLDTYSIDADKSPAVAEMRTAMLAAFEGKAAVIPYRPCALLASAWFPRSEKVLHLGNFHELQACFEHKPWVETQLAAAGVRTVPWRYFADNERGLIEEMLAARPLVVRSNRSDGGTGVRFIHSVAELAAGWPEHADGFLAVAPFLEGIPINANGVAFADGTVSRHGVSVELVGIPGCTTRRFGYCGNDFGAASALDTVDLVAVDDMLAQVGRWLAQRNYRGAFGIDAIIAENGAYLVEVNPRFQGSSRLSAAMDVAEDRADMFLAHIGSFLEAPAPDDASLLDLSKRPPHAHVVVHASKYAVTGTPLKGPPRFKVELQPEEGIQLDVGAMTADLLFRELISSDGVTLSEIALNALEVCIARPY